MSTFEVLESYVLLKRAVAQIRAAELKNLEFGHNQIGILYRLSISDATMGELADYSLTDKASVSRTVASLEKLGFVKRVGDKADRRVINIELTAKGKIQAQVAAKIRSSVGKKLDATLNPAEKKQLTLLTQKIVDHL